MRASDAANAERTPNTLPSQQNLGSRANVIGRVKVAIGLAEDQVVGSIVGSESHLVLVLFLSMRRQDVKREFVQADTAGRA